MSSFASYTSKIFNCFQFGNCLNFSIIRFIPTKWTFTFRIVSRAGIALVTNFAFFLLPAVRADTNFTIFHVIFPLNPQFIKNCQYRHSGFGLCPNNGPGFRPLLVTAHPLRSLALSALCSFLFPIWFLLQRFFYKVTRSSFPRHAGRTANVNYMPFHAVTSLALYFLLSSEYHNPSR